MNQPLCFNQDPAKMPGCDANDPGEVVVRIERVSFSYGRGPAVVKEMNLTVCRGEVHAMLGASGSGKSTLLRLIAGLERPDAGRISICGQTVSGGRIEVPPERRPVGLVFQDYALFPHLNVERNVCFGMSGRSRRERRQAAQELLRRVGMEDKIKAMPHTLSGGQQQRVALARALARNPAVMLLDEPFSGLDADLRTRVRQTTLDVLRETGVAVLMVTHDPAEAIAAADRVSVMHKGRIDKTGTPSEVCDGSTAGKGNDPVGTRRDPNRLALDRN